ncbi:MAG: DUF5678 domain-containing protein [Candidatus Thermoplasmatota archaeon]
MGREELEWISKHGKELEKHSGKWIAINVRKGILASDKLLDKVVEVCKKNYPSIRAAFFLVPRKDEEGYIL